MSIILGIESSCDETAAAVCINGSIVSNVIATQAIHQQYGGVVPELASRAHMQQIMPVVVKALQEAGVGKNDLSAVAFTQSPGLIGALLVGTCFAKSLALSLNIPLIAVHHMQAHVLANLIERPNLAFPFLCLTVSGGHTQIVLAHSATKMELLGETFDDAAGEAFDKTAKILGLPYPGGPLIDQYAQQGQPLIAVAEPQVDGLNFSFSGLKTSVLYHVQKMQREQPDYITENLPNLCASIQARIVGILLKKLERAVELTGISRVCLAGGVSANSGLRHGFMQLAKLRGWDAHIPSFTYCTDNAAMIALTGWHKLQAGELASLSISPEARAAW